MQNDKDEGYILNSSNSEQLIDKISTRLLEMIPLDLIDRSPSFSVSYIGCKGHEHIYKGVLQVGYTFSSRYYVANLEICYHNNPEGSEGVNVVCTSKNDNHYSSRVGPIDLK